MEFLDIVDENGKPTGKTAERSKVHQIGLLHRTSHVWVIREKGGKIQVLLQKRSKTKDSNPGCYDISSAGHIPAGDDFVISALRELKEELGFDAEALDLNYCGTRRFFYKSEFYGKPFLDNQISRVYCIVRDIEPEDMRIQKSEVEAVLWIDFDACIEQVKSNVIPHCIRLEELQMVERFIRAIKI